jgi:flagellar hook-associated protein 2
MATTDFLNALGVGSSFSSKEVITALVDAEKAPKEDRLNSKIEATEAKISALGTAAASLNTLKLAAANVKDASDFDSFSITNSQATALTVSAGAGASAANHSITVSSIAKAQTTNLTQSGSAVFTSTSQLLNSGTSFGLTIQVGGGSGTSHAITVTTTTPQGIADAVNAANIGIKATLVDTGTSGTSYVVQLSGKTGTANSFTVSEDSTSILATDIPTGFAAADASLNVNGLSFSRSSNDITDIVEGLTLSLNSATTGAASISLSRDTSTVEENIKGFVDAYNTTKAQLDSLTKSESGGALKGDTIIRALIRDVRGLMTNVSSSPGASISRLSDLGISITKTGVFAIDETDLKNGLTNNFNEIVTLLSADTTNQTEVGVASRGVAGDLSKLITDASSSLGYLTTQTSELNSKVEGYEEDLNELEEKMAQLQARYEKQFLSMQRVVDEMNNTKDSLLSTFDNLPFTRKD